VGMLLVWLVVCVAWGARSSYRVESSAQGSSFFAHRWEESVGSGHAALSLRADWRSALKQTSQELGFKRVR
jgi:hypothetical protein